MVRIIHTIVLLKTTKILRTLTQYWGGVLSLNLQCKQSVRANNNNIFVGFMRLLTALKIDWRFLCFVKDKYRKYYSSSPLLSLCSIALVKIELSLTGLLYIYERWSFTQKYNRVHRRIMKGEPTKINEILSNLENTWIWPTRKDASIV